MATLTGKKVQDTYKDLLQVSNTNSGVDATMRAVEDGEGTASLLYLSTTGVAVNTGLNIGAATAVTGGKVTQTASLAAATGDEIAYSLAYTTNKLTSGDDYGLKIVQTDTASPGTSYLLNALVATASKFYVTNAGLTVHSASLTSTSADEAALTVNYTTNKASGTNNDTGLEIVQTDTASPGTSYLINAKVATTSKFSVYNTGNTLVGAGTNANAVGLQVGVADTGMWVVDPGGANPELLITANAKNFLDMGYAGYDLCVSNYRFRCANHIILDADKSLKFSSANATNLDVSDAGLLRSAAGVVRVTDGSTGYGRLRQEKDKREFGTHKTPGTAATVTEYGGAPTHTLSGTASNVSDATGHYVQLSGDGAAAGIDLAATECVKTEIDPVVTFIIKTGAALPTDATERIWVGLASASLAASDSPSGIHVAAFRYAIDTDNTAFWRCVTNDGGADAGTATVTTAAIAVGTRYRLTIDAEDSASIKFFVDGALVATHTTNLPTTTQALGCTCLTVDAGANTQEILISKIHYETT